MCSIAARFFSHTGVMSRNVSGFHLLRLMRLKQVKLWRAKDRFAGIMTPGLRDHSALECDLRGVHVVSVIGIVLTVTQHEIGLHFTDKADKSLLVRALDDQWIVAEVVAFETMNPQNVGRGLGLTPTDRLHLIEILALFPESGAFTALAEGKTDDGHVVALLSMKGDCATTAPYDIRSMCRDDKGGLVLGHCRAPS